ncbi:MAG: hypothetical protein LBH20_10965 [Treponema sp.]|jgi:hypothetical protein|nr:hypothetical protein [Treponema sp.]
MKIIIKYILFLLFILCLSCTSKKNENKHSIDNLGTILDENNEFGGLTKEMINNNLVEDNKWSKMIEYFDNNNNLVKSTITPSEITRNEAGIIEQIEYYEEGNVIRYEILYSVEHTKIHDYNMAVELLDDEGLYRTIWLNNETVLDIRDYPEEMNKFVFYNLEYIENKLLEASDPNDQGNIFIVSGKYFANRSVIKFDTNLIKLNEVDYKILDYFVTTYNIQENFIGHYSNKVQVNYGNKHYWLFIQTDLEKNVKEQFATISYYPIMWNNELYLVCVGFFDIYDIN